MGNAVLLLLVPNLMEEVALILVPVVLELLYFWIGLSRDDVSLGKVSKEVDLQKETVLVKLRKYLCILIFSVV